MDDLDSASIAIPAPWKVHGGKPQIYNVSRAFKVALVPHESRPVRLNDYERHRQHKIHSISHIVNSMVRRYVFTRG